MTIIMIQLNGKSPVRSQVLCYGLKVSSLSNAILILALPLGTLRQRARQQ